MRLHADESKEMRTAPSLLDSGPAWKDVFTTTNRKKKGKKERIICVRLGDGGGGLSLTTHLLYSTLPFCYPFVPINSVLESEGGEGFVHKHLQKHQARTDMGRGELPDRQTHVSQTAGLRKSLPGEVAAEANYRQLFLY